MFRSSRSVTIVALAALALPAVARAQLPSRPSLPRIHLGGRGSAARQVPFNDVTVELTSDRLDAAMKGFAVEEREAPRVAADYQQREARYQNDLRQWRIRDSTRKAEQERAGDCYNAGTSGDRAQAQQQAQAVRANLNDPKTQARLRDLQTRMQAASQRQDMPTVMALADSLRQLTGGSQMMQGAQAQQARGAQASQACGMDKAMADMRAAATDTEPQPPASPRDSVFTLAAAAGGFTVAQYAMVRERVLGYLSTDPDRLANASWAYTQKELDALEAHRARLLPYQQMLASQ
jgi:hypothetical protein